MISEDLLVLYVNIRKGLTYTYNDVHNIRMKRSASYQQWTKSTPSSYRAYLYESKPAQEVFFYMVCIH